MDEIARAVLTSLGGWNPTRTALAGDTLLPLCLRCTGIYTGAALGVILLAGLRPHLSPGFLWVHGIFLLQIAPQGLGLVPQNALLRISSGILFGYGAVAWLRYSGPAGHSGEAPPAAGRRAWAYALGAFLGGAAVVAAVFGNAPWVGTAAAWLSLMGLAVLGGLACLAMACHARGIFTSS